jgi:hypothetical protein
MASNPKDPPPNVPSDKGESSGSSKGTTLSDEDTDKIIDGIMKHIAEKACPPIKDANKKDTAYVVESHLTMLGT